MKEVNEMNHGNRKGKGSLYHSDSFNETYFDELKTLEKELSKYTLYGDFRYKRATENFRVDRIKEFFKDKPISDFPIDRLIGYIKKQIEYMNQHSYFREEDNSFHADLSCTNCMSAVLYLLGETDELIEYAPDMKGFVERFIRFLSKPEVQRTSTPKTGDFVIWRSIATPSLSDYLPAGYEATEDTFDCVIDHTGVIVIDEKKPWEVDKSIFREEVLTRWDRSDLVEKMPELQKVYILEETRVPARLTVSPLSEAAIPWDSFDFHYFRKRDIKLENHVTWVSKLYPELSIELKKKYDKMVKSYLKL